MMYSVCIEVWIDRNKSWGEGPLKVTWSHGSITAEFSALVIKL